jgi:pyruvate kinase
MIRTRRTRILVTLGPSSRAPDRVIALAKAGADVFRLNMSHGTHADHAAAFEAVRAAEAAIERPLGVLADLQGPKFRLGVFEGGATAISPGQAFRLDLDTRTLGDRSRVGVPHPEFLGALKPGAPLLIDDGKVALRVRAVGDGVVDTEVEAGDRLSNHKGLSAPGLAIPVPALTEKDRVDLAFALRTGVDWIALSFVQRPDDVAELRSLVGRRAAIMAKIEKPSAVVDLDPILDLCDGVMIARGDLGVELAPEEVPVVQRDIIRAARRRGIPVVGAPPKQ